MSMVTVHGPNTMYTDAPGVIQSAPPGVTAQQVATQGLQFNMSVGPTTRPAGDFTWTASGGGTCTGANGPTSLATFPSGVAGTNQTVTCVVAGAGTPPPANGTYITTVKPVVGMPKDAPAGDQQSVQAEPEEQPEVEVAYDPGAHTVPEVIEFAEEHPDQIQALIDAEIAGKNRATLLPHLEAIQE